jgi:hypothetical protein
MWSKRCSEDYNCTHKFHILIILYAFFSVQYTIYRVNYKKCKFCVSTDCVSKTSNYIYWSVVFVISLTCWTFGWSFVDILRYFASIKVPFLLYSINNLHFTVFLKIFWLFLDQISLRKSPNNFWKKLIKCIFCKKIIKLKNTN